MQTELQQVRAEFAAWTAAQTDEGIKSRCQTILSNLQRLAGDSENEALRQQTLRNVADLRLYGALGSARGSAARTPLATSIIYTFFAVFCTLFLDLHCRPCSAFSCPAAISLPISERRKCAAGHTAIRSWVPNAGTAQERVATILLPNSVAQGETARTKSGD